MEELIKQITEEVIQELLDLEKKKHKAKQRKELDKKRAFKDSYLGGYNALSALGRGILTEDDVEQLLSTEEVSQGRLYALAKKIEELEQRLRKKIKELEQLEKNKPNLQQRLRFCSIVKDAISGKLTSDKK